MSDFPSRTRNQHLRALIAIKQGDSHYLTSQSKATARARNCSSSRVPLATLRLRSLRLRIKTYTTTGAFIGGLLRRWTSTTRSCCKAGRSTMSDSPCAACMFYVCASDTVPRTSASHDAGSRTIVASSLGADLHHVPPAVARVRKGSYKHRVSFPFSVLARNEARGFEEPVLDMLPPTPSAGRRMVWGNAPSRCSRKCLCVVSRLFSILRARG